MKITKKQVKNQLNKYLLNKNLTDYTIFYNIIKNTENFEKTVNKKTLTKLLFKNTFQNLNNNLYIYPIYFISCKNKLEFFKNYNTIKKFIKDSTIIITGLKINKLIINNIQLIETLYIQNPIINYYKLYFLLKNIIYPFIIFKNKN